MNRNFLICAVAVLGFGLTIASSLAEDPFFHSTDALAARDEYGLLHQSAEVNSTDFEPRYHWRPVYYLEGRNNLIASPAYVGALQTALRRVGYYCGETDGIYTDEVGDAIARLQKNFSMRVNGRLTIPVRRALHLP
ncbi:MAG: peptidoglycan-binding domain-containing protein [Verrucomicrobiota bacterium]